ncbi:MAG: V-type ATPase subunit [Synergistaceae bacterium]
MSQQEAYGYAVARIRAMEHRLLDAGLLQRMVEAEDLASALKILGETSYSSTMTSQSGDVSFDKMLESELHATYEEVGSFTPEKELLDLLRYQYDFHNIKVLIKSIYNVTTGGKKRWDLLTSLGSYPVDEMISNVESEEYKFLPLGLKSLVPSCFAILEQTKDILEVERLLDDRLFEVMKETAAELGLKDSVSWIQTRIDGENIRTLLRLKRFNYDSAKTLPFMHIGGTLDINLLVSLIAEPFEGWKRALEFTSFGNTLNQIDASCSFSELILSLEKVLDEYYLDKLAICRYSATAPENILAYLYAKEQEIKNVRMILVAKTSGGDLEQLRRLLRHGYV